MVLTPVIWERQKKAKVNALSLSALCAGQGWGQRRVSQTEEQSEAMQGRPARQGEAGNPPSDSEEGVGVLHFPICLLILGNK